MKPKLKWQQVESLVSWGQTIAFQFREVAHYDWQLVDEKKRAVGHVFYVTGMKEDRRDSRAGELVNYYWARPGEVIAKYEALPHVTRNETPYGASQTRRLFDTVAEAKAWCEDFINRSEKAYRKKFVGKK